MSKRPAAFMANLKQDKVVIFITSAMFEVLAREGWDAFKKKKKKANHLNPWMLPSIIRGLLTTHFNPCKSIS